MICKSALKRHNRFHRAINESLSSGGAHFRPLYQSPGSAGEDAAGRTQSPSTDFKIDEIKEKAFQDGMESGRTESRTMLRASLSPGLTSFLKSYQDLSNLEDTIQSQLGAKVAALAGVVAERILGEPAVIDASQIQRLFNNGTANENGFRLNIHPNDLQALRTILSESGQAWTPRLDLMFKANSAVQPGEVRVEDHAGPADSPTIKAFADHLNSAQSSAFDGK